MNLTNGQKESLLNLTRTSVDDARVSIDCRERNGHPLTVEECEFILPNIGGHQTSLRKLIEVKARKAFRASVRGEYVHQHLAEVASKETNVQLLQANYSTLRRALYLATDAEICERIRREIQTRFPWGLLK